jgi:predicted HicB family RNase H-like nuclease
MLPGLPPGMTKLIKEMGLDSDCTEEKRQPYSPLNKHRKNRVTKKVHKRKTTRASRRKNRR